MLAIHDAVSHCCAGQIFVVRLVEDDQNIRRHGATNDFSANGQPRSSGIVRVGDDTIRVRRVMAARIASRSWPSSALQP